MSIDDDLMADLSISCIDGLVGGVYGGEKINTTADLQPNFLVTVRYKDING